MSVVQGSTLYGGSVSKATIYEIDQGIGFVWKDHLKTEINVDGKPRQLTKAKHAGNPIQFNITNPRDADFGATPSVTIDGRQLAVSELMVLDTFEQVQFKETFPEYQPSGNNIDLKANPQILKVVFDRIMEATQTQVNEIHSAGDDTLVAPDPMRFYDGFIKGILADVDCTEVGVATVITAGNVLDRIYELRNAVPPRLRNKKNLKIFLSWEDFDLFDVARRQTQTSLAETDVIGKDYIEQANGSRMNLVPILGIPKNFMFATLADKSDASNLVQGFWVESDLDAVQMYKAEPADQEYKIVMRFDIGVQHKTGDDIFFVTD